jgi:hypothetical protein
VAVDKGDLVGVLFVVGMTIIVLVVGHVFSTNDPHACREWTSVGWSSITVC